MYIQLEVAGFTGTRNGMTNPQLIRFANELDRLDPWYMHHGDCVGSDAQAHTVAILQSFVPIIHPPTDTKLRAFCKSDIMHPAKDYLLRNRDIVDACDVLYATPMEMTEQPRGGTWSTIRYARSKGKRVIIILPDGSITA